MARVLPVPSFPVFKSIQLDRLNLNSYSGHMKSDSATNIKNNFSAVLDRVKRGEVVLVLEYGRPIAQISKPILLDEGEQGLAALEREGLVDVPKKPPLDPGTFLANRVRLNSGVLLTQAVQADREESI